jgi:hypothetical protein
MQDEASAICNQCPEISAVVWCREFEERNQFGCNALIELDFRQRKEPRTGGGARSDLTMVKNEERNQFW